MSEPTTYDLVLHEELDAIETRLSSLDCVDETGTTRVLTDEDNGRLIRCTNDAGCTLTATGLADGFGCIVVQVGAAPVILGSVRVSGQLQDRTSGALTQMTIIKWRNGVDEYLVGGQVD